MIQRIGFIPPGSRVGGKAQSLDILLKQGIHVPAAQVLSSEDVQALAVPQGTYAVRSSADVEDGQKKSFAGQFLSRTSVEASAVPAAIHEVVEHASLLKGKAKEISIIVQQWVEATVSGVAFSRHPTKDMPEVMVVDAVTGSNERLMSGEVNAHRAFLWNDVELIPDGFPLPKSVLQELKQNIVRITSILTCPVDIEWAWDSQSLWILQARPITALPAADLWDREEARVMHLFAKRPSLVLDRNDFAESVPRPDDATFKMIQRQYREEGPFHQASRELGFHYDVQRVEEYFYLVFGWLYVDATRQPVQMPHGWFAGMKAVLRLSRELEPFARAFYGIASDADPEKTYAKASILAKFAQQQASRPISPDIWQLRLNSNMSRRPWKEPRTIGSLYAVIREDAKVATYTMSTGPVIDTPITLTRHEAFHLRDPIPEQGVLGGEGVSVGLVRGTVIHGNEPRLVLEPRILIVTALTPAWIPFLDRNVIGVISETGSSMSHGAIQCRERGIPSIFGAKGAVHRLKEGIMISMDGKRGTISLA